MTRDGLRRVARTFLFAFLGLVIPGLLGWLNDLTQWARDEGQTPFPDARSLAYLGVAAIAAGFIAVLNGLVVLVEDSTGRGLLRNPPTPAHRGERGATGVQTFTATVAILTVVAIIMLFMPALR